MTGKKLKWISLCIGLVLLMAGYGFCGENSLVIKENGNVGIGTETPGAVLHVYKNDQNNEIVRFESNGGNDTFRDITFYSDMGKGTILREYQRSNGGELQIITGGPGSFTVAQTIASNGNVGVGTTNPNYKLDVNGTIRGDNVSPSDVRFKTNINTIENSLDKVSKLRGVTYEWTRCQNFAELPTNGQICPKGLVIRSV